MNCQTDDMKEWCKKCATCAGRSGPQKHIKTHEQYNLQNLFLRVVKKNIENERLKIIKEYYGFFDVSRK